MNKRRLFCLRRIPLKNLFFNYCFTYLPPMHNLNLLGLFIFFSFIFGLRTFSQNVGIGTSTPSSSAKLEITSTNSGLLIPRIALTSTSSSSPITAPSNSLLVYNTATIADVTPGYYHWSTFSNAWIRLIDEKAWNLNGNAGTVDITNFIGTTDNIPLNFRVNNLKAGRLDHLLFNTFFGIQSGNSIVGGTNNSAIGAYSMASNTGGSNNNSLGYYALFTNVIGNFNTAIGNNALYSNTASNNIAIGHNALDINSTGTPNIAIGVNALGANSTGSNNLAIGLSSLLVNSTASSNLAIGSNTLDANTTGSSNLAIGSNALGANVASSNNVAIGMDALLLSTGGSNVALGSTAGNTITTGTNNTLIGFNSDVNVATLSNATAIGANSVVSASNSLVLGNAANVGIGTSNPVYAKFQVVGNSVFSASTAAFTATTSAAYIRGNDAFSSATTPDYSWYNADQTGLFHPATTVIGFSVNGLGEVMRISNNRLGIGTTTPNGQLELSLNEGRKPGSNTWTVVSDERLKIIHGSYDKGLNELLQLQAIRYNYKNNADRSFDPKVLEAEFIGFSAQEVQKVFPEAVGIDQDGYLNLNNHTIIIAYLNAIKEQQKMIENQQKLLELQQQQIDEIKLELKRIQTQ